MFNDKALAETMDAAGYQFSSANSINIGRLVPQIVYLSLIHICVWNFFTEPENIIEEEDGKLTRIYHQTVKKVTNDFEALGYNTAISQMMIFVNEMCIRDSL